MKAQDQNFLTQWKGTRTKGKWRYILTTGLIWGFFSAIFSQLFGLIIDGSSFNEVFLSTDFLIFLGVFMFVSGPLFGLTIWTLSERKYRKLSAHA